MGKSNQEKKTGKTENISKDFWHQLKKLRWKIPLKIEQVVAFCHQEKARGTPSVLRGAESEKENNEFWLPWPNNWFKKAWKMSRNMNCLRLSIMVFAIAIGICHSTKIDSPGSSLTCYIGENGNFAEITGNFQACIFQCEANFTLGRAGFTNVPQRSIIDGWEVCDKDLCNSEKACNIPRYYGINPWVAVLIAMIVFAVIFVLCWCGRAQMEAAFRKFFNLQNLRSMSLLRNEV